MTALEFIGIAQAKAAQTKLNEARELLQRPSPLSLDSCRSLLSEVNHILEGLTAADPSERTPEFFDHLREARETAQVLTGQIQHGSRFCLGWLQVRMGVGYTEQGKPIMLESTKGRSFEL